MKKTLIVVLGPTGVGKTKTSIKIAQHLGTPIINADSRQIFGEMPIGTAAPDAKEQQEVKHYFVGNHNLSDYYSASLYEQDALSLINELHKQHDAVLLSGGSMMYIDAVCNGIDDIPTIDEITRQTIKKRLSEEGLPALVKELETLDPVHYQEVDKKNPRRVVHALEICHMTGMPYSSFRTNTKKERPFRILKIGLNRPREELYERINRRVDKMIESGLVEEARNLYSQRHLNALNTVGYKELFNYFDGIWTLDEAIERIKGNTRRYMRKQLTWFKRDAEINWFYADDTNAIISFIDQNTQTL